VALTLALRSAMTFPAMAPEKPKTAPATRAISVRDRIDMVLDPRDILLGILQCCGAGQ
jgi:hypothetical protein